VELVDSPQHVRRRHRSEAGLEAERRRPAATAALSLLPLPYLHTVAAVAAVATLAAVAAVAALLGQRHHQTIRPLRATEAAPTAVALHRLPHLDSEELAHDALHTHGAAATLASTLVGEATEHEGQELLRVVLAPRCELLAHVPHHLHHLVRRDACVPAAPQHPQQRVHRVGHVRLLLGLRLRLLLPRRRVHPVDANIA
jgi:hypothetical protein